MKVKALLLAYLVCYQPSFAAGLTLYVAKNGSDSWTGKMKTPNAARSDGPLASLPKARDTIRTLKKGDGLKSPVTVLVRGGVFDFAKTLSLTGEDSGTKECPVTYRAFPGEKVVLTGGRPVLRWKKHLGALFVADLARQGFEDCRFRELFFKGKRQILARFPNYDSAHPVTGGLLYV